jgi:hypothetical protein
LTPLTRIQKSIKESRGLSPRALCRLHTFDLTRN